MTKSGDQLRARGSLHVSFVTPTAHLPMEQEQRRYGWEMLFYLHVVPSAVEALPGRGHSNLFSPHPTPPPPLWQVQHHKSKPTLLKRKDSYLCATPSPWHRVRGYEGVPEGPAPDHPALGTPGDLLGGQCRAGNPALLWAWPLSCSARFRGGHGQHLSLWLPGMWTLEMEVGGGRWQEVHGAEPMFTQTAAPRLPPSAFALVGASPLPPMPST